MSQRGTVILIGSGNPLNIDGIGGGSTVTTKVAMLSKSMDRWVKHLPEDMFCALHPIASGVSMPFETHPGLQ